MGNFNRDRGSRDGGRRSYGGGFRNRGSFGRGGGDRQMFSAVCSNCGKDCQVPFRPTGDKPVYCSDCFEKMGDRGERKSFDRPANQYQAQFETVNAKLDKILNLLQTKIEVAAETPVEEMEVKPSKAKKVAKKKALEKNK